MGNKKPTILIAVGGNAHKQKGQAGTATEQIENLALPMKQVSQLSKDYTLIITHGNGPQVGNLLLQQESCDEVPKMPLEIIGAMTQGQIGYMIESSLDSALMEIGINGEQHFVTLITYVVVDENDPAFQNPTKPIGPFYTEEEASKLPYTMTKTDKGYRRVVASPIPLAIVERREIKKLIAMDFIVICCGGGGIPVIRKERKFRGVEAVIDKDLASSADIIVNASDVDGAAVHWGKPEQKVLGKVTLSEINRYAMEGHFPAGSMGPKVEAITRFFESTGNRGVICRLKDIDKAVRGEVGTEIVK